MKEKIVSPGVFSKEIDETFLPAAVGDIGAVVIGPTARGPALVPTVVSSYSEYQKYFGDSHLSGSDYYQHLTAHTAQSYLRNAGKLTVVKILAGSYTGASVSISSSINPQIVGGGTNEVGGPQIGATTVKFALNPDQTHHQRTATKNVLTASIGEVDFYFVTQSALMAASGSSTRQYVVTASTAAHTANVFRDYINVTGSHTAHAWKGYLTASTNGAQVYISSSVPGALFSTASKSASMAGAASQTVYHGFNAREAFGLTDVTYLTLSTGSSTAHASIHPLIGFSGSLSGSMDNKKHQKVVFKLNTIADGSDQTSYSETNPNFPVKSSAFGKNGILKQGKDFNLRYELTNLNVKRGTFSLRIRRGDDNETRKNILETWNNLSLDPTQDNFISKVIGDSYKSIQGSGTGETYIKDNGTYPNKSKYVYVSDVFTTPKYLDENGDISVDEYSASLPHVSGSTIYSGSFRGGFTGGSNGDESHPKNWYETITETNMQGLNLSTGQSGKTSYDDALDLLSNQDEYDFNLMLLPGILDDTHNAIASKAIQTCEDRGDCFVIIDPVGIGKELTTVTTEAMTRDTNYAAMYYPWVQIADNQSNVNRWVPPSVVVGGMYAYNDKVSHAWMAPAGLNRGTLSTVKQAERKLSHGNRDELYDNNVNPIATFPGQGAVVYGQKTLQKKPSALDRINVRRLLIKVRKFIAASSRFMLFEQNNIQTRKRFVNMVNPYLESVQSQAGLNAFRVVMDESNNTADVIDRNIMYGQIFLQPTRTAEFIVLDFTLQPTGATFPE